MKAILNIILTPFKMIWSIFDNDAHRIMSKKGLNFVEISVKLDKQLAKETPESLTEWMESKRELSECVNCDEVKETHQICMDCIGKLIKENQEAIYTEEQVIEFAKWLASNWFALWVKDKFLWECDWSENAENQDYKGYYTEKQLLELFKSLKQK